MPGHRIEITRGSERVRVEIAGEKVADTRRPLILHEAHMPTRYYIPREDIREELLTPTDTQTHCPFKGDAGYFSATIGGEVHPDIAWYYDEPLSDVSAIRGAVAFFNDRVDIYVDGALVQRTAA